MSDARRVLPRLALATGGMLLLCVFVYLGLGWAVWSRQSWLGYTLRERLFASYLSVAGGLLPGDRDGDGVRDGYEYYGRTDPDNAWDHTNFGVCWNYEGAVVLDTRWQMSSDVLGRIEKFDLNQFSDPTDQITLKAGERLRARGRLLLDRRPAAFPHGFAVTLKPPDGVQVAVPGGALTSKPVTLSVGEDGSVAFDVFMEKPGWVGPHWPLIPMSAPANGNALATLELSCTWARAPLAPNVDRISLGDWFRSAQQSGGRYEGMVYKLRWQSITPRPDFYLVEAARDEAGAEWFPVSTKEVSEGSCEIVQIFGGPLRAYSGPLKFRIVPTDDSTEPLPDATSP